MKICVCNSKGGVGKTTVVLALGLALNQAGYKVGIIDKDPQGTSSKVFSSLKGPELINGKPGQGPYNVILIDNPPEPPSKAPIITESLQESDAAILVSSPSPMDLWTSQETAALITRHIDNPRAARILFNKVRKGTILGRETEQIKERLGMDSLNSRMALRQCYQHLPLLGWSALDTHAQQEVLHVALEVLKVEPRKHR